MTPTRYEEICREIEAKQISCSCCGVLVHYCTYWQQIRMIVDPLPGEDEIIARRHRSKPP